MDATLLTAEEVAALLQVKYVWVLKQAKVGDLYAYKLGRHWRFNEQEVAKWLSTKGNRSTSAAKEPTEWSCVRNDGLRRLP